MTVAETDSAVTSYYYFDAESGRLIALHNYVDDSVLTFTYSDSGKLERVTSSEGIELSILYNGAGLVDTVTLLRDGQDISFVTYVEATLI